MNQTESNAEHIQQIRKRLSGISIRKAVLITFFTLLPFGLILIFLGITDTVSALRMEILVGVVLYMVPLALIFYAFRKKDLRLHPILKDTGKHRKELLLVIPLMFFSISAIWVTILCLNAINAGMAQSYLEYINSIEFLKTSAETPYIDYIFIFAAVAVLPPLLEELVFRGSMIERLGFKYGYKSAVILSSVIFGILHINIVSAFAVGLFLSLIYLKTYSLFIPIIIHAINNGFYVVYIFIDDQFLQAEPWDSIAPFIRFGWIGVVLFLVSAVWLALYLKQNWGLVHEKEPISKTLDSTPINSTGN